MSQVSMLFVGGAIGLISTLIGVLVMALVQHRQAMNRLDRQLELQRRQFEQEMLTWMQMIERRWRYALPEPGSTQGETRAPQERQARELGERAAMGRGGPGFSEPGPLSPHEWPGFEQWGRKEPDAGNGDQAEERERTESRPVHSQRDPDPLTTEQWERQPEEDWETAIPVDSEADGPTLPQRGAPVGADEWERSRAAQKEGESLRREPLEMSEPTVLDFRDQPILAAEQARKREADPMERDALREALELGEPESLTRPDQVRFDDWSYDASSDSVDARPMDSAQEADFHDLDTMAERSEQRSRFGPEPSMGPVPVDMDDRSKGSTVATVLFVALIVFGTVLTALALQPIRDLVQAIF